MLDVNRDGLADVVLALAGVSINSLLTTSSAFLSEGNGRFSPWNLRTADGGPSADSLGSVLGSSCCAAQHFVDFDGDGQMDYYWSICYRTILNRRPFFRAQR